MKGETQLETENGELFAGPAYPEVTTWKESITDERDEPRRHFYELIYKVWLTDERDWRYPSECHELSTPNKLECTYHLRYYLPKD